MDIQPPTEAEVQAAVRREQARQHRYMSLNSDVEWAKAVYTEEDRLLLDGDSPEQLMADRDTIRRHQTYEEQKKYGLLT